MLPKGGKVIVLTVYFHWVMQSLSGYTIVTLSVVRKTGVSIGLCACLLAWAE